MAYLGGKDKGSSHIISILNNPLFDDYDYIEPFCGYCHILRRVKNKKSYIASDLNKLLIHLLKHIQSGGKHYSITPNQYLKLKKDPYKHPIKAAYAAFTYSFNGKYFGGYVNKYKTRNYPQERKRYYNRLKNNKVFQKTKIHNKPYTWIKTVKNKLIYCDPPYENTTEYDNRFDSDVFWDTMRHVSKNNFVFISEYKAPKDFICIDYKFKRTSLSGKGSTRKNKECLFIHQSKLQDPIIKSILKNSSFKTKYTRKRSRK